MSGADIVREDLKRQIQESQSAIWRLKNKKKLLTDKCRRYHDSLDRINRPSEKLEKSTRAKEGLLKAIDGFKEVLSGLGGQNSGGENLGETDDHVLESKVEEIALHRKKLGKLRDDKNFLLATITDLVGGEGALLSLIEAAKKYEQLPAQMNKGEGKEREVVEIKHEVSGWWAQHSNSTATAQQQHNTKL